MKLWYNKKGSELPPVQSVTVISLEEKKGKSSVETQLIFSFIGLAACFDLNRSIIRPLYKTNSRYNIATCEHAALSLGSFVGSHSTIFVTITTVILIGPSLMLQNIKNMVTILKKNG